MKRRAFSLLEALFTLGLVFMILGLANDMFRQYSGLLRFSEAKSSSLNSMQVALQQVIDEARCAQTLQAPSTVGATSAELKFVKVDSSNLTWMNNATVLATGGWIPAMTSDTQSLFVEVRYYLSDGSQFPMGTLLRDVGPVGAPATNTWPVAENIAGLQFTGLSSWPGSGELQAVQVDMSLRETTRILSLRGVSMRPPI